MADSLPEVTIPRYSTDGALFSRDALLSLFREHWGRRINDGDVNTWLVEHFTVSGQGIDHIVPTDYIAYPDLPDIDDGVDDQTRAQIMRDHEERRRISRRSRQLFDIDNLPVYVRSTDMPSPNDSPALARRKADYIHSL